MALPDLKRSLIRTVTVPIAPGTKVNVYSFASASALATILAAGFFNFARMVLQPGDIINVVAGVGGTLELATVKATSVPAAGNVTVEAGDSSSREVTATDDGLTTGLILASDANIAVTSANAAHIITLPAIASVPLGKEIWGVNGATACEMRTPAESNTKINGGDADSNEAVIAASVWFVVRKVAADQWALLTGTGGAVAAPTPD